MIPQSKTIIYGFGRRSTWSRDQFFTQMVKTKHLCLAQAFHRVSISRTLAACVLHNSWPVPQQRVETRTVPRRKTMWTCYTQMIQIVQNEMNDRQLFSTIHLWKYRDTCLRWIESTRWSLDCVYPMVCTILLIYSGIADTIQFWSYWEWSIACI